MADNVNVYLVDDDAAVRHALLTQLVTSGYSVKDFDSAESFLARVDLTRAGVLLLDQRMAGMSGLELQKALSRHGNAMPIIFITGYADIPMSVIAMRSGAVTVLEKPLDTRLLIESLEEALAVAKATDKERRLQMDIRRRFETLTSRERDVLEHLVEGLSNRKIAEHLGISNRTVEVHRCRIMRKMGAATLPDLVLMASQCDLGAAGE